MTLSNLNGEFVATDDVIASFAAVDGRVAIDAGDTTINLTSRVPPRIGR